MGGLVMRESIKTTVKNIEHIIRIFVVVTAHIFLFFLFLSLIPIASHIALNASISLYSSQQESLNITVIGVILGASSLLTIAAYVVSAVGIGKILVAWVRNHKPQPVTTPASSLSDKDANKEETHSDSETLPMKKKQSAKKKTKG